MKIYKKYSLKLLNTFRVECFSDYFIEVNSEEEIKKVVLELRLLTNNIFVLGGGSNLLFTKDFRGGILKINIKGIRTINEDNDFVYVEVGGGENWHDFVLWTIKRNLGGVENLSFIPGKVGAAPIQNIGAYGVEVKDSIEKVFVIKRSDLTRKEFTKSECRFGYRNSYFKNEGKDKYIIFKVIFKLRKQPVFNTSYGIIKEELSKSSTTLSIKKISDVVIKIRQSKLPDPNQIGNGGSFFKNPIITKEHFNKLFKKYPDIIAYFLPDGNVKVAAGWMIEKIGWKGKRFGDVGVHEKQALVLVNYGKASGMNIFLLAKKIQKNIYKSFDIILDPEVNIL